MEKLLQVLGVRNVDKISVQTTLFITAADGKTYYRQLEVADIEVTDEEDSSSIEDAVLRYFFELDASHIKVTDTWSARNTYLETLLVADKIVTARCMNIVILKPNTETN